MNQFRARIITGGFILLLLIVLARLFYWQVLASSAIQSIAQTQHQSIIQIPANRGKILSSDGYPIVDNQPAYITFAYVPDLELPSQSLAATLGPLLAPKPEDIGATPSAEVAAQLVSEFTATLSAKLTDPQTTWIPLSRTTLEPAKKQIEALNLNGIGFEASQIRYYPESSMAANLVGFVGSDGSGNPKGYFGLEGRYNFELTGRPGIIRQEKDALGKPIVTGDYADIEGRDGRSLKTYIDRGLQFLIEKELRNGIERYQALSGEIIIVDPQTGGILAMASLPSFDPNHHRLYESELYKNPSISDSYEPGSTFKTIIMAAAINEQKITPETTCNDECKGPVTIGKYTIRTWNNQYNPGQTMAEVLERSDNTGMVYIAQKLGKDTLIDYIKKFGFGTTSNIDLEGEISAQLRSRWGDIDVATASFGQGIAVNSLQMIMGVAAIANQGKRMEPHVVQEVIDGDNISQIPPKIVEQVITPETAKTMTDLMVLSASHGDAQWAVPKELEIAGKTGTAQIPIAGHYDAEKTVASFVGFAPASSPRFAMIIKLREPQTSIWASETAAPLWFRLAKLIFQYYNIPVVSIDNLY